MRVRRVREVGAAEGRVAREACGFFVCCYYWWWGAGKVGEGGGKIGGNYRGSFECGRRGRRCRVGRKFEWGAEY